MEYKNIFKMPTKMKITGRTSTITNAFVSSIIPSIEPHESEIKECLAILGLDFNDLRCAYCGDRATEWDHFRPLVSDKRPTGFISEIRNLVPSCPKCNQSKGNKPWRVWIVSNANESPKTRQIKDLNMKIEKLGKYEQRGQISPINFAELIEGELWRQHWDNCEKLHKQMESCQNLADQIKMKVEKKLHSHRDDP